jgi:predicted DCC family thiol-disulfide oxidoreductase YuxK
VGEAQAGSLPGVPDPVLLYDGSCGFCAASVQFILRHEHQQNLRFAPLEGRLAEEIKSRHPDLRGVDSLVWIDGPGTAAETVLVRSHAVLRAAGYLGGMWGLARAGAILPASFRDALYDFVARHRHKILGSTDVCYLPPPKARFRFLE